jgi:ribokinase
MGRVVVVGSYNADLTVAGARLPAVGETVAGRSFTIGHGGKGSNQAIGAKRLGADVALVANVGDDRFGASAIELFRREGLVGPGIQTVSAPTGVALIMVDDRGRNMIAVAQGANAELTAGDLDRVPGLFRGASHLLCQLECPAEVFVGAARVAREAGVVTILNPAPAMPVPADAFGLADILIPNETELAQLSGSPAGDLRRIGSAARTLVARGTGLVVVTLGERGALAVSPAGVTHVPARTVVARDTTGAGDGFVAGFVTALAEGAGVEEALQLGVRAGAYCVTRPGVLAGLATRDELDRSIPP